MGKLWPEGPFHLPVWSLEIDSSPHGATNFLLPLSRKGWEQQCFLLSLSKMIVHTKYVQADDFNKGGSVNPKGKSTGSGRGGTGGVGGEEALEC